MTPLVALGVAVAGGLGALARVGTTAAVERLGHPPRVGTLAANLLGTLLLAVVLAVGDDGAVTVVGGGFCGALTTFSTWVVEAATDALGEHEPDEGGAALVAPGAGGWARPSLRLLGGLGVGAGVAWAVLRLLT